MTTASSTARDIPIRKAEPGAPLPYDYGTTPGGTIYSSTPGGTRIIYDRNTLLNLRNSPLSRTPPTKLAYIPGITKPATSPQHLHPNSHLSNSHGKSHLNVETHGDEHENEDHHESDEEKDHSKEPNKDNGGVFAMDME